MNIPHVGSRDFQWLLLKEESSTFCANAADALYSDIRHIYLFFYNTNIECRYLGRNKEDLANEVCVGEKLLCL